MSHDNSNHLICIFSMMGASICFTLNESMMKLTSEVVPIGEIMFVRGLIAASLISLLLLSGVARKRRKPVQEDRKPLRLSPLLLLVGLGEMGAGGFAVASVSMMPVASFTAILQLAPLVLTATGAIFLREAVGWRRWLATLVGFGGVLLIIRPGTDAYTIVSILPVIGVMFSALRDLSARRMGQGTPALVVGLVTSLSVCPAGIVLGLTEDWVIPTGLHLLTLIAASVFLVAAYLCVIFAVRNGPVSVSAPFRYIAVPFAALLGFTFWSDVPDLPTIIGTGILVAAGLYTLSRERRTSHRTQGRTRG